MYKNSTNGDLHALISFLHCMMLLYDVCICIAIVQLILFNLQLFTCRNCPDFDLCEQCDAIEGIHNSSHVFLKLRFPGIGIGRKHGVMIPLLKDIIYKNKNVEL